MTGLNQKYKTAFHSLYNSTPLCMVQQRAAHLGHAVTFYISIHHQVKVSTKPRRSPAFVCSNPPTGLQSLGCSSPQPPVPCGSVPGTCTCCDLHLGSAPQHAEKLREESVKEVIADRHHHRDGFQTASILTGKQRESEPRKLKGYSLGFLYISQF